MQALFFFLLNFALVNFFIFIYATYQKNLYKTSSLNALSIILYNNPLISIPIKFLFLFVAGLPFTFLFFGYFYIGLVSFKMSINFLIIIALVFSSCVNFTVALKILNFINSNKKYSNQINNEIEFNKINYYQIFVFWILILVIYTSVFSAGALNNLSTRFALFLLSISI